MYTEHTRCRACGHLGLEPVADFGPTPLANDFRKPGDPRSGYAPLKLLVCEQCWLPQLSVVVDPHILYDTYSYIHSDSCGLRKQFSTITDFALRHRERLGSVLEFGSNDGLFLSTLKDLPGVERVFGIDPGRNLCVLAQQRGVSAHCGLFSEKTAMDVGEPYDTIFARHVFSHIDNWADVVRGLSLLMHRDSVAAIEVQYGADLLNHGEWDMIYHEHLSYLTVGAVEYLLTGTPLMVTDVQQTPWMGGSIILGIRRREANIPRSPDVAKAVMSEPAGTSVWREFYRTALEGIGRLGEEVTSLVRRGTFVRGYGAPAKASNWINLCNFSRREIAFVTDTTPAKQGKLIPGRDIPIVSPASIPRGKRDEVAVLFAWNFEDEIAARESEWLADGGRFLVPLPGMHYNPAPKRLANP